MKQLILLLLAVLLTISALGQDKVKLIIDGKEAFVFDSSRISILNNHGNTFIGRFSGSANSPGPGAQGQYNTFIGEWSGYNNTSGTQNTFLGSNSGHFNTLGDFNTFIGDEAGLANTTGSKNTYVGENAGRSSPNSGTGTENTFIGHESGLVVASGTKNSGLGASSLQSLTTGTDNTALGTNSLRSTTTGSSNVAVGSGSLQNATVQNYNVAVGHRALENNGASTTDPQFAFSNVAVGAFAMFSNDFGSSNVALGSNSLHANTDGHSNTAIGTDALASTNGNHNVAIGYQAGASEIGSHKLYIENGSSSSPLIYGEFDNDILRVNGELQVGTAYKFPTAAGANGQILRTDGSGQLSWQNDNVIDADADPTNELLMPAVFNFPHLELQDAGGLQQIDLSILYEDADADPSNELLMPAAFNFPFLELQDAGGLQQIDLSILYEDGDANPGNELQALSLSGKNLSISNGNTVALPSFMIDDDADTKVELFEGATDGVQFTVDNTVIMGVDAKSIQFFNNAGNTFVGENAGESNGSGASNTFLGKDAGKLNSSGGGNTFVGSSAGAASTVGINNTYVGSGAGLFNTQDTGNVFIGYQAGHSSAGSNKLFIDNSGTSLPLIKGDFHQDILTINGDLRAPQGAYVSTYLTVGAQPFSDGNYISLDSNAINAYQQVCTPFCLPTSSDLWLQSDLLGDVRLGANARLAVMESEGIPSHKLTVESFNTETMRLIGPYSGFGYGARLNFGDNNLVYLQETTDDVLTVYGQDTVNITTSLAGSARVRMNTAQVVASNDMHVNGTLSKSSGSFRIDHPLDPENKYLYHSFVESPDMMNIYNGNVILDNNGQAVITMPDWFEPLNRDFRYQLTAIGAPGPNLHISKPMTGNAFEIGGGSAGMQVSWQVTGIRQDAFANANRIPVEEMKPVEARGKYQNPEAFGKTVGKAAVQELHPPKG